MQTLQLNHLEKLYLRNNLMLLIDEIKQRLQILEPISLEIIDESHLHAGHTGNKGGGHFKLRMQSAQFNATSQVIRHRMIYTQLGDLMVSKIHALSIEACSRSELI